VARTRPNRPAVLPSGSSLIEPVVAAVRAIWQSVEASGGTDEEALKREISDTVQRLKDRIERKLRRATLTPIPESLLFDVLPKDRRCVYRKHGPCCSPS
jgi:hypothetical protein